jgi:hypothetical protein
LPPVYITATTIAARSRSGAVNASQTVPAAEVTIGDRLLVHAGEVVPVDGLLTDSDAVLNESALTGEPIPIMRRRRADGQGPDYPDRGPVRAPAPASATGAECVAEDLASVCCPNATNRIVQAYDFRPCARTAGGAGKPPEAAARTEGRLFLRPLPSASEMGRTFS